jgi:hypothetical protein
MDKDKIKQDLEKTHQQINNLEVINEKSDITIDIPDKDVLDKLYNDFKTFGKTERNILLTQISQIEGMNAQNKKFSTMKPDQRNFLLEKLRERVKELDKKMEESSIKAQETIELFAKEA